MVSLLLWGTISGFPALSPLGVQGRQSWSETWKQRASFEFENDSPRYWPK
jgi:hypothetical protein